jgi:putative transcriptional regulator
MTISHHPPDDLLADYAVGALPEAEHLVVAVHAAGCARCQRFVRTMETLAGAALADGPPAPPVPGEFETVMERIARSPPAELQDERPRPGDPELADLPELLQSCRIGPRRWVGPGLTTRPILLAPARKCRAFLLHAQPGTRLIQHTHTGDELTCVLKGSYTDHHHRYEAGDLDFSDEEVEHELVVGDDGPCLCLVALTGDLKLHGLFGRLISPFVRL